MKNDQRKKPIPIGDSSARKEPSIDHPRRRLISKDARGFDFLDERSLFSIQGLLARDEHVPPEHLAGWIEANPRKPLTAAMRKRVCLILRNKYHQKRGPRHSYSREVRQLLAFTLYHTRLKDLRAAKAERSIKRGSEAGKELHRQVAQEAIDEFRLGITVEAFLNLVSGDNARRRAPFK
jgi:hypothetical protein